HGTQLQTYQDTPHGKPVRIHVQRKRYRCQACGKTQFDPIPDLDSKRVTTTRLVQYICTHSTRETFAAIARRVGLDEKTVKNIFEDYVADLEQKIRFVTPKYLGIDELKIIGEYRCMITNVEHRTVFDMLPNRKKAELMPYFRNLRDKEKIEWVAMDMWGPYRDVVRATLPHARIVVDKFHIQRMANEVLERMRKRLRKTLPDRQRLKLKDERHLLLKRQHTLSPEALLRLQVWLKHFPQLGQAHGLKEGFFSIWDQSNRSSAETAYQQWEASITDDLKTDFKDLTTAMRNWGDEVFAYFDHPITNAYTESVNNLAKGMNRMGRGYSFEVIRARMLYDAKARKAGTVIVQEPAPERDEELRFERREFSAFMTRKSLRIPLRTDERVVEYGPYIPTLTRLLEESYFE
ncbi:MAG: ISL3 family transposase, partial [Stenotrophobium sp.]